MGRISAAKKKRPPTATMMSNMTIKLGIYQHHKGMKYRVLGVAKHSETLEDLVVYEALYDNKVSKLWVRPLEMFLDKIEKDGKLVNRFEFVGEDKE